MLWECAQAFVLLGIQVAGNQLDPATTGITYEFTMMDIETVQEFYLWLEGTIPPWFC